MLFLVAFEGPKRPSSIVIREGGPITKGSGRFFEVRVVHGQLGAEQMLGELRRGMGGRPDGRTGAKAVAANCRREAAATRVPRYPDLPPEVPRTG